MKHLLLAALISLGIPAPARATTQIPDEIELDAISSPLQASPLYSKVSMIREEGKLEIMPNRQCSANWRGYKAYWRVLQDKLNLVRVVTDVCTGQPKEVDLKPINKADQVPLFAGWFTGVLVVPRGQPKAGSGADGLVFKNYMVLVVQRGRILSRTTLDEAPR